MHDGSLTGICGGTDTPIVVDPAMVANALGQICCACSTVGLEFTVLIVLIVLTAPAIRGKLVLGTSGDEYGEKGKGMKASIFAKVDGRR